MKTTLSYRTIFPTMEELLSPSLGIKKLVITEKISARGQNICTITVRLQHGHTLQNSKFHLQLFFSSIQTGKSKDIEPTSITLNSNNFQWFLGKDNTALIGKTMLQLPQMKLYLVYVHGKNGYYAFKACNSSKTLDSA